MPSRKVHAQIKIAPNAHDPEAAAIAGSDLPNP